MKKNEVVMELKHIHTGLDGHKESEIVFKIFKHSSLDETMQDFSKFLLAIGFHPEGVKKYIEEQ